MVSVVSGNNDFTRLPLPISKSMKEISYIAALSGQRFSVSPPPPPVKWERTQVRGPLRALLARHVDGYSIDQHAYRGVGGEPTP